MLWVVSLFFSALAATGAMVFVTPANAVIFSAVGACLVLFGVLADSLSAIVLRGLDDFLKEANGPSAYVDELAGKIRSIRLQSVRLLWGGGGAKIISVGLFVALLTGKIADPLLPTIVALAWALSAFAIPLAAQQVVNYLAITDASARRKIAVQKASERAEYLDRLAKAPPQTDLEADPHLQGYGQMWKPKPQGDTGGHDFSP